MIVCMPTKDYTNSSVLPITCVSFYKLLNQDENPYGTDIKKALREALFFRN
jgi:hypothetical protein